MMLRVLSVMLPLVLLLGVSSVAAQEDCSSTRFSNQWPMTDFCNSSIDLDEIISGGPPKDGIPALTDPVLNTVEEASKWLGERAPVIAVEIDGEARAYPQAILIWHEIANDEIAGVPIAVTFCPLCNSSIVFDRRVDGEVLEFGVSGVLRNSDMVMYDRQTESWWQQFIGQGIVGTYNGTTLDVISSVVISFSDFAERYPDGLVASRDTGYERRYGTNPYTSYDIANNPFLFTGEIDPRLPATEHVLAGVINGEGIAYPFAVLSEEIVINDRVGDVPVVAFWQPGVASALNATRIDQGRDIGTAALYDRTLADGTVMTFQYDSSAGMLVDEETGTTWNLFGEAIEGELAGTSLRRLIAAPHFWFAWAAFYPETAIYGQE
ncbi:MAG: DUF3179 domain-containing protein [Anaerolineae bacterium]|nr:DUF3179 domain-containing protein [Anaerolineae bacterium]